MTDTNKTISAAVLAYPVLFGIIGLLAGDPIGGLLAGCVVVVFVAAIMALTLWITG